MVTGWLGWVPTSLPNSCGVSHVACWVLGGIQEGSSYGSSDAEGMLCNGPLCGLSDIRGLQPSSWQAMWAGKLQGRCQPHASSPTCPQLWSGARGKRTASIPRTAKGTSVSMLLPCNQSSQGAQHSLWAQPQIATHFPKETHFPPQCKQELTRKWCWQPPPVLLCRCGDAWCPPGGKSALPAAAWLFTAWIPVWRGPWWLGTLASCGVTACHSPATSTQEETL